MTHTPTPWAVGPYGGVYRINDDGIHGPLIVSGETRNGALPNKEENEAFIVAAVNAYDKQRALIEILTDALERLVNPAPGVSEKLPPWAFGIAKASLATAKQEQSQ